MNFDENLPSPLATSEHADYVPCLTVDPDFLNRAGMSESEAYIHAVTLNENHGLNEQVLLTLVLAGVARCEFDAQPTILQGRFLDRRVSMPGKRRLTRFLMLELQSAARRVVRQYSDLREELAVITDPFGITSYADPIAFDRVATEVETLCKAIRHLAWVDIRRDGEWRQEPDLIKLAYPLMRYWWATKAEMPGTWRAVCGGGRPPLGTAAGLMADAMHLAGWRFTLADLAPVYEAARQKLKREIKKAANG